MTRTRRTPVAALALVAVVALAACGGDDADDAAASPPESTEMADDDMADDDMADDEMADDDMADDDMADDEMADDDMADDDMADDDMADDDMADDDMADDDMADDEMADDDMADDDMADDDMADDDMADDDMADDDMAMNDVMSLITGREDLTVLDDAIHAVGLQGTLHDGGPFTVFAPTDEAFAAYLGEMDMTADDVLADTDATTVLLQAHVVEGSDDAAMVMAMDGQAFTTLAGNELTVVVDGDTVMIGDATIVEYDIVADNGVVHVIDTVLTPPAG